MESGGGWWCEGVAVESVATLLSVTAVLTIYLWWRCSEVARMRSFARGVYVNGDVLPSPVPALPRWLGFLGGHTLILNKRKVEGWAKEFGGDYELYCAGKRSICVTGLADIRRILTLRPSKFKRGLLEGQVSWAAKQCGIENSMFFEEGSAWGRSRRIIAPNFSRHNVASMMPAISKFGQRFCDSLAEKGGEGVALPGVDTFARYTHDIISWVALGLDVGSINASEERPCQSFDAEQKLFQTLDRLMIDPLAMLQWILFPMLPWVRNSKEKCSRAREITQDAIDAVRLERKEPPTAAKSGGSRRGNILHNIIRASAGKGKSTSDRMLFSDKDVVHEATSMSFAGTESSALSISWAMYYLSKNPEAFMRCRAEALRVAPSSNGLVSTSEQLSQLEFCSAVLKEAIRRAAELPLVLQEQHEDEFTMETGQVLKKGDGVFLLVRAAGSSEQFFTRAKEFVPERWIDAEREQALLPKEGPDDGNARLVHEGEAYLTFGHGPRMCPGQDLAKAEATSIIAAVCAQFDVSLAPGQIDPPEEITALTCSPKRLDFIFSKSG